MKACYICPIRDSHYDAWVTACVRSFQSNTKIDFDL